MSTKETPLLKQYNRIKLKYPDTILLFRLGDFFETFNEDAKITSQTCGITLTRRNNGAAGEVPLAGFPHHQLDNYLPKLVRAGYRVAVCEQLEDPKMAKGIVKRDVVEVVTPGAALYDKLLDTKRNNFLASLFIIKDKSTTIAGFACTDISTGEFYVSEVTVDKLLTLLESFTPSEIIISKQQKDILLPLIERLNSKPHITRLESWIFDSEFAEEAIKAHFNTINLKGYGIENMSASIAAAGSIFYYLKETRQGDLSQIQKISNYNHTDFMELDFSTRRNLEITFSMSTGSNEGSLISILDRSYTPMGGRLFRKWLSRPLLNLDAINHRLTCVDAIIQNKLTNRLGSALSQIGDIERLITKINNNRSNPRDIISLASSIKLIPDVISILNSDTSGNLTDLTNSIEPMAELVDKIDEFLSDNPGQLGSGNVFRLGINEELDSYIDAKYNAKIWLNDYQEKQREITGISTLKVGFTNVFGYYIEISNAHKNKIPENFNRKQTLTNAERYITPELKEFETKILNAENKIQELENEMYTGLINFISVFTAKIQQAAAVIAQVDCLNSFAIVSLEYNYTKPVINQSDRIQIKGGRHPVVERLLPIGEKYSSNDTSLDINEEIIHIITGPNMAGKSCYLRQVALIIYLGQIGCFVPAVQAEFGLTDRIFTRVGAQDNITSGESTFLVEMQEAANILNNATQRSLILLDEVGRGTATFDGISIAWAITEYIHDVIKAKTLFATHYHELNELALMYDHISNYKIEVIEADGKLMFTHKVAAGGTDHSFGIHVAQMAGLPSAIISRAYDIMKNFEESSSTNTNKDIKDISILTEKATQVKPKRMPEQLAIFEIRDDNVREKINNLDINNLSPIQALQFLSGLHDEIRKEHRK